MNWNQIKSKKKRKTKKKRKKRKGGGFLKDSVSIWFVFGPINSFFVLISIIIILSQQNELDNIK